MHRTLKVRFLTLISLFLSFTVNGDVRYQNRDVDRPVSIDTVGPDPSGGVEILGRGVRELVQAIQDLRHIGIEDLVLPLPKIVVVGDQSTGKSSLIEGIRRVSLQLLD